MPGLSIVYLDFGHFEMVHIYIGHVPCWASAHHRSFGLGLIIDRKDQRLLRHRLPRDLLVYLFVVERILKSILVLDRDLFVIRNIVLLVLKATLVFLKNSLLFFLETSETTFIYL